MDRAAARDDHSHHNHAHGGGGWRIGIAALLTGVFMVAEAIGGLVSGSLALIADAGHMLVDFAGLALAWFATHLARRPADARRTYGFGRFEILVAFGNGLVLFMIAALIAAEAARRLADPVPVLAGPMLWIAAAGLAVNLVAFGVLHGGDRENINMRGALLHVMGDLLGSVGAIVASVVILWTGWTPVDPILSVVVAAIILGGAWRLVRDSGHILLEAAPTAVPIAAIAPALMAAVPAVEDVHHVHAWSITERRRMVTLHARIRPGADGPEAVRRIKAELTRAFRVEHATVEVETGPCADADADCREEGKAIARDHGRDHTHDHGPGDDHRHHHGDGTPTVH